MLDNLLASVMRELPRDGFKNNEERQKWFLLFKSAFEVLYPDATMTISTPEA